MTEGVQVGGHQAGAGLALVWLDGDDDGDGDQTGTQTAAVEQLQV